MSMNRSTATVIQHSAPISADLLLIIDGIENNEFTLYCMLNDSYENKFPSHQSTFMHMYLTIINMISIIYRLKIGSIRP